MSPDENKKTTSKRSNTPDHQINNTKLFLLLIQRPLIDFELAELFIKSTGSHRYIVQSWWPHLWGHN